MALKNKELLSLKKRAIEGDKRALAKVITLIENNSSDVQLLLSESKKTNFRSHIIGITGSPGSGKSTLVNEISASLAKSGKRVAILAVDPSSPFSGGAILGDRIRMSSADGLDNVYIRSMATRGALGGLSKATFDAVSFLELAGFNYIIIETVGVGQAEIDIVRLADTCLVVLVPGMGDSVQSLKAGIMEIADIFVVNKADKEGADLLVRDLKVLLTLSEQKEWQVPICKTIALKSEGIAILIENIKKHLNWLTSSKAGAEKILANFCYRLKDALLRHFEVDILSNLQDILECKAKECLNRKGNIYLAKKEILEILDLRIKKH